MSWSLSLYARRIIAVLLLLFDLGQEPGSALSFVGLEDADDDAVAELCTKEDFWWGTAPACTVNESISVAGSVAYAGAASGRDFPPVVRSASSERISLRARSAVTFATVAMVTAASFSKFLLFEPGPQTSAGPLLHRNTYIGQKRDIVLIV